MPNPVGAYTEVHVSDITKVGGEITNGTGTYTATGIFSCGPFAADDRPVVDSRYNITGKNGTTTYEFPGVACVASNQTSDFR